MSAGSPGNRFYVKQPECLCERDVVVGIKLPKLNNALGMQQRSVEVGSTGDRRQQEDVEAQLRPSRYFD